MRNVPFDLELLEVPLEDAALFNVVCSSDVLCSLGHALNELPEGVVLDLAEALHGLVVELGDARGGRGGQRGHGPTFV